jgi:hypothetical protein
MNLSLSCCPAGKEVEETLRIVDAQTQEAAAKKQVVEGEEAIASEKAAAAKAIKVWSEACLRRLGSLQHTCRYSVIAVK